ncbi:nitroreductase family protein [Paenibacillus massiliensis]|uniref:nitroreductase family protein n=1 Tax=Paenibacillus massiliensis TaxID=225917 RepID=UPI00035D65E5|nr:nitroreductase family protein [Paenibacillus massiliensis]
MSDLKTIIETRRSAVNFVPDTPISEEELQQIFSLNRYAPSAFNLQHSHYIVATSEESKEKLYQASKQYKVKNASATIVVLGDTKAYLHAGEINAGMLNLGMISKLDYDQENEDITRAYESGGEAFQRDEAIRNASLSAMQLMLIAKDHGWDTCPMIGFDPAKVQELFEIPERYVPVMLITLGKSVKDKERPRGYRKPVNQYVNINSFQSPN